MPEMPMLLWLQESVARSLLYSVIRMRDKGASRMGEKIDVTKVPVRKLYTGAIMPAMGLGTFGSDKYSPEQISEAVYGAVKAGYRMLDCASVYQNEDRIGEVIERLLEEKVVSREELFVTSKVWNDQHREVKKACEKSLKDLDSHI